MDSGIVLSAATRSSLLAAQNTATLLGTTQNRLATGKEVNSALDNPTNFFTASNLNSRAGDLNTLLDGISNGIQTIQAASTGITNIQKLVDTAKSVASQALSTQITTTGTASNAVTAANLSAGFTVNFYVNGTAKTATIAASSNLDTVVSQLNTQVGSAAFSKDTTGTKLVLNGSADIEFKTAADQSNLGFAAASGAATTANYYGSGKDIYTQSSDLTVSGVSTRASLATQYNSLLTQINQLASDSSFNGVNLINSSTSKLHVQFNEKDTSNIDVSGQDLTSTGLSLSSITAGTSNTGNFLLDSDIKTVNTSLTTATNTLRSASSTLGSSLSVVQNRQDFAKNLINVLQTGASNLTDADLNTEAANSQALSTRQSLAISALSLANTAQQNVLQLLR